MTCWISAELVFWCAGPWPTPRPATGSSTVRRCAAPAVAGGRAPAAAFRIRPAAGPAHAAGWPACFQFGVALVELRLCGIHLGPLRIQFALSRLLIRSGCFARHAAAISACCLANAACRCANAASCAARPACLPAIAPCWPASLALQLAPARSLGRRWAGAFDIGLVADQIGLVATTEPQHRLVARVRSFLTMSSRALDAVDGDGRVAIEQCEAVLRVVRGVDVNVPCGESDVTRRRRRGWRWREQEVARPSAVAAPWPAAAAAVAGRSWVALAAVVPSARAVPLPRHWRQAAGRCRACCWPP